MIILKILFYFVLLVIDSIILQVLVFINPHYGTNSADDIINIMNIYNEINELSPKIRDLSDNMKSPKIGSMSTNDADNTLQQIYSHTVRYYELLVQLHTSLFNVIING